MLEFLNWLPPSSSVLIFTIDPYSINVGTGRRLSLSMQLSQHLHPNWTNKAWWSVSHKVSECPGMEMATPMVCHPGMALLEPRPW
jgi:hypothetical protein